MPTEPKPSTRSPELSAAIERLREALASPAGGRAIPQLPTLHDDAEVLVIVIPKERHST